MWVTQQEIHVKRKFKRDYVGVITPPNASLIGKDFLEICDAGETQTRQISSNYL